MSLSSDVDTAMGSLKTAIAAYTAAAGNQTVLTRWLIGQIRDSDQGIARALDNSGTQFNAAVPDRRTFASIG